MLLPVAANDNAVGGLRCGNVELRFLYATDAIPLAHHLKRMGRQKSDGRYRLQPIRMRVESEYCL